ncbi:MAG: hypothetical protein ABS23_09380 [SAR92 bacterium BACL16 MAG-120619-bin48]|nr:MAG: hypothetical protein ABS23_09380 [SAR92 bacterium BACL16 MAG-120619-bin48]
MEDEVAVLAHKGAGLEHAVAHVFFGGAEGDAKALGDFLVAKSVHFAHKENPPTLGCQLCGCLTKGT